MATLYSNIKGGTITDSPLSSGATTINSAAFANLPAVTGADILWITLDPAASAGAPEIVKVTAHTASATSVTVVRGQQSTSARSHNSGTVWKHAATKDDYDAFLKTVVTANITDDAVTNAKIGPSAVTATELASDAVTTAKILDANVTAAKLASNAVTTAKILDANVTLAKLEAAVQATLAAVDPADAIISIAGSTAPTGWVLCDGTAYSRATYAATFARIGTTYGAGDGSTTFNVPDLRNRFVAGKGTATWSDALAETGGSKDAVAVAHTHTSTDHSHTFSGTSSGQSASHTHAGSGNGFVYWDTAYNTNQSATTPVGPNAPWALSWQVNTGAASNDHTHTYSGTTSGASAGNTTASQSPTASGTDANLPPYLTLNYCIRLR